jgi:protein-S-isoprenylcysteine O-methyltransferase Ste14
MILVAIGYAVATWTMSVNRFFSGVVRIQKDRGHTVVADGPYRYVRHPAYATGIISNLATAVALGSLWAIVPAFLNVCIAIVRTALEDATLQDELEGYRDYSQKVRYRLLPGVW